MIVSDTERFMFIHVPKCAGTSVRKKLAKYDTRNNYYWMHEEMRGATKSSPKLKVDKAHLPIALIKRLYPEDFDLLGEYTTFGLSRHPRERLVSAFLEPRKSLLQRQFNSKDNAFKDIYQAFREYIEALVSGANFIRLDYVHATPQKNYHIYNGKIMTDAIIKLESPVEGIRRLKCLNENAAEAVTVGLRTRLNSRKGPKELDLWGCLSKEQQLKCRDIYREDCELLGYEWE